MESKLQSYVCHAMLATHGEARRNAEFCVLCHNPSHTDQEKRGPEGSTDPGSRCLYPDIGFAAKGHGARASESEVMREFKTHHFRFGQVTSFDSVKIIRNGEPILLVVHQDRGAKLFRHSPVSKCIYRIVS